jgi:hypothetical protein
MAPLGLPLKNGVVVEVVLEVVVPGLLEAVVIEGMAVVGAIPVVGGRLVVALTLVADSASVGSAPDGGSAVTVPGIGSVKYPA